MAFKHFRAVLNEGGISRCIQYIIELFMQMRKSKSL